METILDMVRAMDLHDVLGEEAATQYAESEWTACDADDLDEAAYSSVQPLAWEECDALETQTHMSEDGYGFV